MSRPPSSATTHTPTLPPSTHSSSTTERTPTPAAHDTSTAAATIPDSAASTWQSTHLDAISLYSIYVYTDMPTADLRALFREASRTALEMQRAQDTTVRERRSALLNDASLSEEERDARLGQLLTNYAVPNDSELEALLQQEQDILQELDRRGEGPEEPQAGPQAGEQAGEQAAVQAEAEPAEAPVQPEAGP